MQQQLLPSAADRELSMMPSPSLIFREGKNQPTKQKEASKRLCQVPGSWCIRLCPPRCKSSPTYRSFCVVAASLAGSATLSGAVYLGSLFSLASSAQRQHLALCKGHSASLASPLQPGLAAGCQDPPKTWLCRDFLPPLRSRKVTWEKSYPETRPERFPLN